jgi:hypothetical protein
LSLNAPPRAGRLAATGDGAPDKNVMKITVALPRTAGEV